MWRIARWSADEGRGRVQSPHFDLPFDAAVGSTESFVEGEEVSVEVVRMGDSLRVRRVEPVATRPERRDSLFSDLNLLGLWEYQVDAYQGGVLTFVGGRDLRTCIEAEVTFHDVYWFLGSFTLRWPLFRLAAPAEEARIRRSSGCEDVGHCYAILSEHGRNPQAPQVYVIAESAEARLVTVKL